MYEKGPLRQVFRWDQIEHIQSELRFGGLVYVVRRLDGYEVTLNKIFPDVTELITIVAKEFLRQATAEELKITHPEIEVLPSSTWIARASATNKEC